MLFRIRLIHYIWIAMLLALSSMPFQIRSGYNSQRNISRRSASRARGLLHDFITLNPSASEFRTNIPRKEGSYHPSVHREYPGWKLIASNDVKAEY